jgi:hypothetical protein
VSVETECYSSVGSNKKKWQREGERDGGERKRGERKRGESKRGERKREGEEEGGRGITDCKKLEQPTWLGSLVSVQMKGKVACSRFLQVNVLKTFLTDKSHTDRFWCTEMWNDSSKTKPEIIVIIYPISERSNIEKHLKCWVSPSSATIWAFNVISMDNTWHSVTSTLTFSANLQPDLLSGLFYSDSQIKNLHVFILHALPISSTLI